MDKISIIVPVYNIEKNIEKTVLSIQKQTYKDIEIILIDDGSTDESGDIIERIAREDERVHAIHQENNGVTAARLAGVKGATGDWIGFVDGDDYIEPDMYERLLQNARRYQADISHCGYQMVFPSRTIFYYNTGRIVCQDTQTGIKDLLEGRFVEPSLCNKLFRKDLFDRLLGEGLVDQTIKNNEDLLMNYYLFSGSQKSVYEDFCPYHYMVREGSAATGSITESKLRDPLRVMRIISEDVKENSELSITAMNRYISILISQATKSVGKGGPQFVKDCKAEARKELNRHLKEVLLGSYSVKIKLQALWAALLPGAYEMAHGLYGVITGNAHKFEVR